MAFLFLVNNINVDSTHRLFLNKKFLNKNKNFFKSQIKSRCVESFRSRSPLRDFHLSRVVFRMSASRGALLGIKKSS